MATRFRSALLAATLFAASFVSARAAGPIQAFQQVFPTYNTYSAVIVGLTPAASATDLFTITGSATKQIWIRRLACSGTATAAASDPVQLVLRSTADTGGTSTAPVVIQLNAAQVGPTIGPTTAATAVVAAYTANPTLGTSVGPVGVGMLELLAPASAGTPGVTFDFPLTNGDAPIILNGAAAQLAVNANVTSLAAGAALNCVVTWTEH